MVAASDSTEAASLLINAGADVNARNTLDKTPLSFAKREGCTEMVELLRQHAGLK